MTQPVRRYAVTVPNGGPGHGEARVLVVCLLGLPGPTGGWLYADALARIQVEIIGNAARLLGLDGRVTGAPLWHAVPLPDR